MICFGKNVLIQGQTPILYSYRTNEVTFDIVLQEPIVVLPPQGGLCNWRCVFVSLFIC